MTLKLRDLIFLSISLWALMQYLLSAWHDLELPRRQTSGHACEGLSWLGHWDETTLTWCGGHHSLGLDSGPHTEEKAVENELPDCAPGASCSCCTALLPGWTVSPGTVSYNKSSFKSLLSGLLSHCGRTHWTTWSFQNNWREVQSPYVPTLPNWRCIPSVC